MYVINFADLFCWMEAPGRTDALLRLCSSTSSRAWAEDPYNGVYDLRISGRSFAEKHGSG
jgi:hypothetical protein